MRFLTTKKLFTVVLALAQLSILPGVLGDDPANRDGSMDQYPHSSGVAEDTDTTTTAVIANSAVASTRTHTTTLSGTSATGVVESDTDTATATESEAIQESETDSDEATSSDQEQTLVGTRTSTMSAVRTSVVVGTITTTMARTLVTTIGGTCTTTITINELTNVETTSSSVIRTAYVTYYSTVVAGQNTESEAASSTESEEEEETETASITASEEDEDTETATATATVSEEDDEDESTSSTTRHAHISTTTATTCGTAYQQCGGIGYSGLSCCAAGLHCVQYNAYWARCISGTTIETVSGTAVLIEGTGTTITEEVDETASASSTGNIVFSVDSARLRGHESSTSSGATETLSESISYVASAYDTTYLATVTVSGSEVLTTVSRHVLTSQAQTVTTLVSGASANFKAWQTVGISRTCKLLIGSTLGLTLVVAGFF